MRTRLVTGISFMAATALLLAGCSSGTSESVTSESAAPAETAETTVSEPSLAFVGPNGEIPGGLDELLLSNEESAEVSALGLTAVFVWHTSGDFTSAVEAGAREQFEALGIKVLASTQANFDAATQADNVASVLALDPDIVVAIAVDPTSAASSFQQIVDDGRILVIMTTPPAGYRAGQEFVSIVTADLALAGKYNAELLIDAMGNSGEVVYMYHDADFWFTNQRDQAFKNWLGYLAPDINIVEEAGFTDEARTQEIAAALLTKNPNITGFYVPWATAAQGVLAAVRDAGRDEIKIVTNDLDTILAADMYAGGNVVGISAPNAFGVGKGLAIAAAYGALGKPAPELVASEPIKVTAGNLADAWKADLGVDAPASVFGK
jgi:ribose transport system substrate-binding protein